MGAMWTLERRWVIMSESIITEFDHYISGRTSLEQFEEWVLGHLQETLDSDDIEMMIKLMDEADTLFMQLRDSLINEVQFIELFSAAIANYETHHIAFSSLTSLGVSQTDADVDTLRQSATFN